MSDDVNGSQHRRSHFQRTSSSSAFLFPVYTQTFPVYTHKHLHVRDADLEQVEDLLAEVQLEVCVVGACHVVNEHQAVPLGLEAEKKKMKTSVHV